MNSLTYLARQFDVAASPRTPPSTPIREHHTHQRTRRVSIDSASFAKRTRTWSITARLIPQQSSSPPSRRSYSSPPDGLLSPEPSPNVPRKAPVSHSSPEAPVRSTIIFEKHGRKIVLFRVFVVLWDALFSAWRTVSNVSLSSNSSRKAIPEMAASDSEGEKSESDMSDDEKLEPILDAPPKHRLRPPLPSIPPDPLSASSLINHLDMFSSYNPDTSRQSQYLSTSSVTTASSARQSLVMSASSSRSVTPTATAKKTPFHSPKTLVLDLDETLIHSTSRPIRSSASSGLGLLSLGGFGRRNQGAGHVVEVVLGGKSTLYHVYKRPFVDYFLRKVSAWYTLVIFTASMQEYADPVIDWLDAGRGIIARRLFRESCTQLPNGSYTKDLSIVETDLSRVCLIDNSPVSYSVNEANGIPIEGWTHDPSDEALLALLPVLDSLRFTSDVRRVLGIRGFS